MKARLPRRYTLDLALITLIALGRLNAAHADPKAEPSTSAAAGLPQDDATADAVVRLASGTPPGANATSDQRTIFTQQPNLNANPESLLLPKGEQAKLRVHQYDWGVFNRDGGTAAGFGPVGRYGTDRAYEDWRVLADPAARRKDDDPFDLLKYIPLTTDGQVYLTFSGEERFRTYYENRPELGTINDREAAKVTLRSIYGADLHVGPNLRFYGELINGDAGGIRPYGYSQSYTTRLDLLQAFAELKGRLLGATNGLVIGRMQFLDAPDYVFYQRTVSNVPESWNGVRAYSVFQRVRFDLFDFAQTNINPPALFNDKPAYFTRLFGAYESYAVPDFKLFGEPGHVFADTFYYGYIFNGEPASVPVPGATRNGSSRRDNYGVRLWGKAGPIEFSLGAIYQDGHFYQAKSPSSRPVDAYALNNSIVWRFSRAWGQPSFGVQGDLYSGGNTTRSGGTINTYVLPFVPSSNYLDTTYYIGTSNVIAAAAKGDVMLGRNVLLKLKLPFYWRDSTNDAFYSPNFIYGFHNFSGGYIGTIPQATLAVRFGRHLTWTQDLGRFFASTGVSRAGGSDATYYLSTFTFDF